MRIKILVWLITAASFISCKQENTNRDHQKVKNKTELPIPKIAQHYLTRDLIIKKDSIWNHVRVYSQKDSDGKYITIIPSLGRGVEDFTEVYKSTITTRLVEEGYRVVLIQPRGIGKSKGELNANELQLKDLANDIKTSLDSLGITKIHVVGHAFGNRLARTFATIHTDYVDGLALLASGGNFEIDSVAKKCLRGSFNLKLPDQERLQMINCAFFAKGNDASIWLNGWYPDLALAEIHATRVTNGDFYKKAGGKPFLLVQASEDFIAPPNKAGKVLKNELGSQVTYVEIHHAGHALTSEQPEKVVEELIKYFK